MQELINKFNEIKGVSFVSIVYTNAQNELQHTVFNVGTNYSTAKEKDLETLKQFDISEHNAYPQELLQEALDSLINDFEKPSKPRMDNFIHLDNGLKMHQETHEFYVWGMEISKKVLVEGEYKEDTRKPLTKAKDYIRSFLRTSKFRQYKIERAELFTIKGDTLVFNMAEVE